MDDTTTPKLIVLADDDSFISHAYRAGLEAAGYTVSVAADGEQALQQARVLRPDVLIMELILPELDGFNVLRQLKQDVATSSIPVIILTNLSQDHDQAEARSLGANEFLVKSEVSLPDVTLAIGRVLR